MAEVLSIPQSEGGPHFGSPLRRSSSQTSFRLPNAASYSRPSSHFKQRYTALDYDSSRYPASLPSSAPSSPRFSAPGFSNQPSYTSTPLSSLSLDEQCQTEGEDILFPSYDDGRCYEEMLDAEHLSSPEPSGFDDATKSASDSALAEQAQPPYSDARSTAGDDTAIEHEPTRHVDYLSHSWREEDIWASWKHIVAKRKVYSNSARLENASWRTWAKCKYQLRTVSPETLNWYASSPYLQKLMNTDFD